jgi:hypothetical protein
MKTEQVGGKSVQLCSSSSGLVYICYRTIGYKGKVINRFL